MTWYRKILYFFCSTCRPHRSRTVRYAFPFVAGALVILSALTISSEDQTIIEIIPSENTIQAGDVVEIDVFVDAHTPVNAIDITLEIPQSQLTVTGIDTGESVITLWTEDPYVENNTVYLRGGTFRKGFLGRHQIAKINAEAAETGRAYINIEDSLLLAGDGEATEIEAVANNNDKAVLYIADENGVVPGGGAGTFEASVEIRIVTDIDGDGSVTLNDISRFMTAWFSRGTIYDFSGDGRMTFRDFSIILSEAFFR